MVLIIKAAESNNTIFPGALSNDTVFAGSAGERLLFGLGTTQATMVLSQSNLNITGTGYALDVTGQIRASDDITAFSDSRYKYDLQRIPGALDKVSLLSGYTYKRVDGPADKLYVGLVAQEVLDVLPEAVRGDEISGYSVAYGNMAALFVEAIKDLRARVEALEKAVAE
jgi:hypothetical protein